MKLEVLVELFMLCEYGCNVEGQQEAHFWARVPAHGDGRCSVYMRKIRLG